MSAPDRAPRALLRRWLDRWLPAALLAAAAAVFVSQCLWLGEVLIDDAYITFSFSKNLARGDGPVYSHGLRVEGYSNFLWMVLVAAPLAVARRADPVVLARFVGAPFVALLGWATYRLAALGTRSRLGGALAVLLLSFVTDIATAYLSGLETAAYVALLTASLALLLSSWRTGPIAGVAATTAPDATLARRRRRARTLAAWCALAAALTRIDGFLVLGLVLGLELAHRVLVERRLDLAGLARWAGPVVAVYACWFAWRWSYYGLPLPSTYYAKALIPKLLPDRGFTYVSDELRSSMLYLGLGGAAWLLLRRRTWAVPLALVAVVQLAYVTRVGGDWMPFGRFVMPATPLLVVLLVAALVDLIRLVPARLTVVARAAAAVAALAVLAVVAGRVDHRFLNTDFELGRFNWLREQRGFVRDFKRAATYLRAAVPPGRRLVTDYAGVFGYYTDAAVIDMWGLATPIIARRGGTAGIQPIFGRTCPECYPELDPEFFHVMYPLVRPEPVFKSAEQVITQVWQTDTIGRYIDFRSKFAVGRVVNRTRNDALYFLEKRGPAFSAATREESRFRIEYPFEPPAPPAR